MIFKFISALLRASFRNIAKTSMTLCRKSGASLQETLGIDGGGSAEYRRAQIPPIQAAQAAPAASPADYTAYIEGLLNALRNESLDVRSAEARVAAAQALAAMAPANEPHYSPVSSTL